MRRYESTYSQQLFFQMSWHVNCHDFLHLSCQIRPKSSTPTSCSYSVCPISKAPFGSNLLSSWFALISLILISCFLLLLYFFSFKIGLLAFILCIPGLGALYIHNSNFYSLELFPFHFLSIIFDIVAHSIVGNDSSPFYFHH